MKEEQSRFSELATVQLSITASSARLARAERKVACEPTLPAQAEMRGFLDVMLGLRDARLYSEKLRVSYEQGLRRGKKHRAMLDSRGYCWWETEFKREGRLWEWRLYKEGFYVASGRETSQVKAENAAFDVRFDHAQTD